MTDPLAAGSPTDVVRPSTGASGGRARRSRSVPRWVLAIVFALGFGHAALYAVSFPPWAIEDEQQHVDYTWKLAFDHELPSIEDEIDYAIVEGIFGADRFTAYDMAHPQPNAASMGLQARSYAAYHPPAAYLALAPVVAVVGPHALLVLYLLRAASALAAGAVAVATARLAVDVARSVPGRTLAGAARPGTTSAPGIAGPTPPQDDLERAGAGAGDGPLARRTATAIALAAGIAMAMLPALADSGGRVDTDIYATLVVVVGCRLVLRWADEPGRGRSWSLGLLLAVAVLTRETALVLAVPVLAALVHRFRNGRVPDAVALIRVFGPPVAAGLAWSGYQWQRAGVVDGSQHFLELYGDQIAHGPGRPLAETLGDAVLVPYGAWGVPWIVVAAVAAVAAAGVILLARSPGWIFAATAAGMVAFVALTLAAAVGRDLNVVSARLLLPAYPAVVAAATVGWASRRSRWATFALAISVTGFGLWFAVAEMLSRFPPRLG